MSPLRGIPLEFLDEITTQKPEGSWMGLLFDENCIILTLTVFDWTIHVMDRRMDGW